MNSVLIVEPHPYHYEVIPSIVFYFRNLDYSVSLLVQDNFVEKDIFCRFNTTKDIYVMKYKQSELQELLRTSKIARYDFVFFNSYEYFHDGKKERLLDYLGYVPQSRYGILGIIHNREILSDEDIQYLKEGRIFALTPCQYKGYDIKLLSASFFGENVDRHHANNSEKKRFLMIGTSNSRELAETALSNSTNLMIEIVYIGYLNFKKELVCRVGKGLLYFLNRKKYKKYKFHYNAWKTIKYYGKLDFSNMYQEIENTDYIMIVMDVENLKYDSFLNGKTSGAKQLVLGFNKPCLICEKFGKAFGFDENSAILYNDNNLAEGLKRAYEMNDDEYLKMKYNLGLLYNEVIEKSKNNILSSISQIILQAE